MSNWENVLVLDRDMSITGGSEAMLRDAVASGADLRIYTEFRQNEHIDIKSDNNEVVREVSDFRVTYLVDNKWVAGIMNMRMPIGPPAGFGGRPSMSFFMYNQNGQQAIARPHLDGIPSSGTFGPGPLEDHSAMPKYRQLDAWDTGTNAPSSNFIYYFDNMRFIVRNDWREVLSHSEKGELVSGSFSELTDAFSNGAEVKIGIADACADLGSGPAHELFVHTGPGYYNTGRNLFTVGSQPVVRVKPDIPMIYKSRNWNFGWLMVRTDGFIDQWLCDPYTLKFQKNQARRRIRWFVR